MSRATRLTKPLKLDWTILFCFIVLSLAPVSSIFWYFIPVAVSLLLQVAPRLGLSLGIFSFIGSLSSPLWLARSLTELDFLGIFFLFGIGIWLYSLRRSRQSFLNYLLWPLVGAFLSALVLTSVRAFRSADFSFEAWAFIQMHSEIFPYFFHGNLYPEAAKPVFDSLFDPILRPSLLSWFAAMMAMAFFVNGLMENLLKSFRAMNVRGQARVFDRFNRWKAPEMVLIPIALGLSLVATNYWLGDEASKELSLVLRLFGWNLCILGLFPVFVQGISLTSFLIPRVNPIIVAVIFIVLFINPIPVLVLAGFGDLWFDLRSRDWKPS